MTTPGLWSCPTCKRAIATNYCPECGERSLDKHDLTLRGLFRQFFKSLSSVDGRLIRSYLRLVNHPGALTAAYIEGQRIPYVGPLRLFFFANVLFVVVQSLTHMNIFSSPLNSHLYSQDWSALAQALVSRHLAIRHTTLELYAPVFNHAVVLNAKTLIILMVLCFAMILSMLFYRSRKPLGAHVAFSLHLYAFLLLLFCVSLVIAEIDLLLGGDGLNSTGMDKTLSVINFGGCAAYLHFAVRTVYGATGVFRIIKTFVLALSTGALVLGYRFALFLITLYTT